MSKERPLVVDRSGGAMSEKLPDSQAAAAHLLVPFTTRREKSPNRFACGLANITHFEVVIGNEDCFEDIVCALKLVMDIQRPSIESWKR